tara:strand:- start:295 stop:660 length:366 start_codon:yes stop_codon:yes gene_type:complete
MAHYAKVNNGIVETVIVAEADFFDNFVDDSPGTWIQTSYNTKGGVHSEGGTPLRKNYAGTGFIYDSTLDAFYEAQPFPSWTLNESTCLWAPPMARPDATNHYHWDEPTYQGDNTKGWILQE